MTPQEMSDLTEPWRPYRSLGRFKSVSADVLSTDIKLHRRILHVGFG